MKINVCIVENSPIYLLGLKSIFNKEKNIAVAGCVKDDERFIQEAKKLNPDVILMDISFLKINNILAIPKIENILSFAKLIIMSKKNDFLDNGEEKYFYKALKRGISGCLTLNASEEEILKAINFAYEGKRYLHQDLNNQLINSYILEGNTVPEDLLGKLSDREKEVLELVSLGKSSPGIADSLEISESTVKTYRQRFMDKLGLHNLQDLIKFSIRNGIISM